MENTDPNWYLRTPDGVVYGPVTFSQLALWKEQGRLLADSEVSTTFPYVWQAAKISLPQLFELESAAEIRNTIPHRGSWLIFLACLGLFCGCPIFSIAAWVMAAADLREMAAGHRDIAGESRTRLAWRIGAFVAAIWIAVALIAFMIAIQRAAQSM